MYTGRTHAWSSDHFTFYVTYKIDQPGWQKDDYRLLSEIVYLGKLIMRYFEGIKADELFARRKELLDQILSHSCHCGFTAPRVRLRITRQDKNPRLYRFMAEKKPEE